MIITFLDTVCDSEDVIIWSDLDEIPNPEVIENMTDFYTPGKVYRPFCFKNIVCVT